MAQNGALFVFCSSCKILFFASSVHPKIATDWSQLGNCIQLLRCDRFKAHLLNVMLVIMSLPVQMRTRVELEGNQMRIATNNYSAKKICPRCVFCHPPPTLLETRDPCRMRRVLCRKSYSFADVQNISPHLRIKCLIVWL